MTCGADSGVGRAQADMYEAATVVYRPLMRLFERRRDAVKLMNAAKHLQSLYERIEQTVRRLLCAVASLPFPVNQTCLRLHFLCVLTVAFVALCDVCCCECTEHNQIAVPRSVLLGALLWCPVWPRTQRYRLGVATCVPCARVVVMLREWRRVCIGVCLCARRRTVGQEFVYKEPKLARLADIQQRLKEEFSPTHDTIKFIMKSGAVNTAELEPGVSYIQIIAIAPYLDMVERAHRKTNCEQWTTVCTPARGDIRPPAAADR